MRKFAVGAFLMLLAVSSFEARAGVSSGFAVPSPASAFVRATITIGLPPNTPPGPVYLTGSTPELCQWKPRCIEMQEVGHGMRQAQIVLDARGGARSNIEFKITRGDWASEATDQWGRALPNFTHDFSAKRPEFTGRVLGWKDAASTQSAPAAELLEIVSAFYSPELRNSRAVRVLLPESYRANPKRRYPVIYMHDGQNVFDPRTAGFGVEWSVDEVLHGLARTAQVPEAIVVAVDCSSTQRSAEYDYFDRGRLYARFLVETLKPWVDQRYRTHPERESTYAMGSSMGALISLALVWKHSDVFSKGVGLSLPAFARRDLAHRIIDSAPKPRLPIQFYVDYGDAGGDAGYVEPGRVWVKRLRALGLVEPELMHREFPYADHNEADWARRVDIPLKWLLGR
jgi:predicted alpha/beta superfamily hydrolase